MKRCLFFSLLIYTACPHQEVVAYSDWHSGGVGFAQSSDMPWFEGEQKVSYCFKIDEDNFGVDLVSVRKSWNEALGFWDQVFTHKNFDHYKKNVFPDFYEEECRETTQFKIYLGVWPEGFPGDPKTTVARAVQVSRSLYVSPEKGHNQLERALSNRWSYQGGWLLSVTLMHEIGHVLGFPHDDRATSIMNDANILKLVGAFFVQGFSDFSEVLSKEMSKTAATIKFDNFLSVKDAGYIESRNTITLKSFFPKYRDCHMLLVFYTEKIFIFQWERDDRVVGVEFFPATLDETYRYLKPLEKSCDLYMRNFLMAPLYNLMAKKDMAIIPNSAKIAYGRELVLSHGDIVLKIKSDGWEILKLNGEKYKTTGLQPY